MVIAGYHIFSAIRNKLDYTVGADLGAGSAAYTLFLVHLDVTLFIIVDGMGRTNSHTGSHMKASFLTAVGSLEKKGSCIAVLDSFISIVFLGHILATLAEDVGHFSFPYFHAYAQDFTHLLGKSLAPGRAKSRLGRSFSHSFCLC